MDSSPQKWLLAVLKRMLGVRDTAPSWCVMRECGLEPLQFNWFRVAMQLYNSLTKSNSYTMEKVLPADMQLSTRSKDCWPAHILSAMHGLTQSYIFKQREQHCEPIDLSHFVVDLRERHLEYTLFWKSSKRIWKSSKRTQQQTLYLSPMVCSSYKKGSDDSFALHSSQTHVSQPASWCHLQYRLRVHTLCFETATWSQSNSPTCDLCDADDVQDEQHVLFHSPIPTWFLSTGSMHLCFSQQEPAMCLLSWARTVTSFNFFSMNLLLRFMSRLALALLDWRPFL
jgi:hypothetical protein